MAILRRGWGRHLSVSLNATAGSHVSSEMLLYLKCPEEVNSLSVSRALATCDLGWVLGRRVSLSRSHVSDWEQAWKQEPSLREASVFSSACWGGSGLD